MLLLCTNYALETKKNDCNILQVPNQLGRFGLFIENVANFGWLLKPILRARDSWNPTLVKRMLKSGSMLVHTMHTAAAVAAAASDEWLSKWILGDEVRFASTWVSVSECDWMDMYYHHIRHVHNICAGLLREKWLLDSFHSNISFLFLFHFHLLCLAFMKRRKWLQK